MLRAVTYPLFGIDAKFWGLIVMFSAIAILFVLPWLDKSPVNSMRYKGWYSRVALLLFIVSFLILGVLGTQSVSPGKTLLAQIMTVVYFGYFFLMPWYTRKERTFPVPERVTMGRWITWPQLAITLALLIALVFIPLRAVAAEAGNLALEHAEVNFDDKDSLQRGWKNYMNYCVGCHSLQYARYERTANDLEVPLDLVMENLVFDDAAIGDLMENAMSIDDAKVWFGAAPPDLTLVGRVRSADWLYTYLKSFYNDESRPLGTNNTIFANVGMPNVLHELQGDVECELHADDHGGEVCELHHVEGTGSLTEEEFDQAVNDIVNFLYYIGEPVRERRKDIGIWVLLFLAVLYGFIWATAREFSKDYH
jgi:ubiquinol-cytochrome c reductase cytochrome b subunit